MPIKLNTASGGGVILQGANTASDTTLTVPAVTATVLTDSAGVLNIGSGQVYKDASGNVGIGTSSPSARLQVNWTSGSNAALFQTSAVGQDVGIQVQSTATNGGNWAITTSDSTRGGLTNSLAFQNKGAGTAPMLIDSSGNLLVGTTSQINSYNVPGSIQSLTTDAKQAIFRNSNATAGRAYTLGMTNNSEFIVYANASTGVYLSWNATSWTSSSDERVKDIIEPITNAAEKVSSLRAVIGKYKTDEEGTRRSFLIAQDVQAVLPEAVNAKDDEIGTLGLQYTDMIPLLVAAIKEQQAMIDELKAKVAALEAK